MAISNVRSAEFRAAGGRQWYRTKSGNRQTRMVGTPRPTWLHYEHDHVESEREWEKKKQEVREHLAQGYDESLVTVIPEGKRAKKSKRRH